MRTCWTKRRRPAMWQSVATSRGPRAPPRGSTPWSPITPASLSLLTREILWGHRRPLASKRGSPHHSQVTKIHPWVTDNHCNDSYCCIPFCRFSLWHWAKQMVKAICMWLPSSHTFSFIFTYVTNMFITFDILLRFSLWHWAKHPTNQWGPDWPIDQTLWQEVIYFECHRTSCIWSMSKL